jgi:DNA-binding Lrp family transcriptional regulator
MFAWRNYLEVHPAADDYPLLKDSDPAAFRELVEDIRKHGLRANIVLWEDDGGKRRLLDGRNRLDALAELGVLYDDIDAQLGLKSWTGTKWAQLSGDKIQFQHLAGGDPYALALSYNVHRRHLTSEQRRDLIAKVIKATPEKSNRQIAEQVKVSHPTVAKVRERLEEKGDVVKVTTSIDTKWRKQPAKKRKAATTSKAVIVNVDTGPPAQDRREADLRRTFTDAVHTLISLTSHPSARFASIVPPSDLQMVANFLNQIAADDAAASAEAMKAKQAEKPTPTSDNDLGIPGFLRRTAQAAQ